MDLSKLDKIFSEYIRRRDADENGNVKCCTCPTVQHWKEMDCGHWRLRGNMATRFNENNSHSQCKVCNGSVNGMWDDHKNYIILRYGLNVAHELYLLSKQTRKFMQFEIDEMVKDYKLKIKQLES